MLFILIIDRGFTHPTFHVLHDVLTDRQTNKQIEPPMVMRGCEIKLEKSVLVPIVCAIFFTTGSLCRKKSKIFFNHTDSL